MPSPDKSPPRVGCLGLTVSWCVQLYRGRVPLLKGSGVPRRSWELWVHASCLASTRHLSLPSSCTLFSSPAGKGDCIVSVSTSPPCRNHPPIPLTLTSAPSPL
eukprot:EG_transcript_25392